MKKRRVTFDELRALLLDLGFTESGPLNDRCQLRIPSPTPCCYSVRIAPTKRWASSDMLVVRRQLVDNGLIEASGFEHFLQQATA